jgi:hypothetical protein
MLWSFQYPATIQSWRAIWKSRADLVEDRRGGDVDG